MFVEIHVLQNFVPSCLNRDDTNAPKDCTFGGHRRARISSQCIKRSVRRYFQENAERLALEGRVGVRTKLLHGELVTRATRAGLSEDEAGKLMRVAVEGAGLKMGEDGKTSVLLYVGEKQIDALAEKILAHKDALAEQVASIQNDGGGVDEGKAKKKGKKAKKSGAKLPPELEGVFKALREGPQAVDVALFGRMIAELKDLNVDASCQVGHALSTHKVDMEMDFYTAVDDLQPSGDTGAGMMGIVEFNSSCFYRYAVVDIRRLTENLGGDAEIAGKAVQAFAEGFVHAVPTGKQNSMAAHNPPSYVRVVVRKCGAPRSLANAFVQPVKPTVEVDLVRGSIEALQKHDRELKAMYGAEGVVLDLHASHYDLADRVQVPELIEKLGGVLG